MTVSTATRPDQGQPRPWRVSEVNAAIADALARRFAEQVWITGEISSLRERSGNVYFDLVEHDRDGRRTVAELPAVILRWERRDVDRDLDSVPGFALEDGLEVLVGGRVTFYEPWGKVQLQVLRVDPQHSLGAMALAREQLLASLRQRGVLGRNAERPVGLPPRRIGLVTSPDSRAERDLVTALSTSGWAFEVVRASARVQGPTCESSVSAALHRLARMHARAPFDVVALVRGGGSAVDLSGFDTAGVAEAIVGAPFPVWTGIGHEQDRSVADEVAHTAWATPTSVGQGIVAAVDGCAERINHADGALREAVSRRLEQARRRLGEAATGASALAGARLRAAGQRLDGHVATLSRVPEHQLARARRDLRRTATALSSVPGARIRAERLRAERFAVALRASAGRPLAPQRMRVDRAVGDLARSGIGATGRARSRVDVAAARLEAVDPARQLARGYSITRDDGGRPVRSIVDVQAGARITSQLADGRIASRVEGTAVDAPGDRDGGDHATSEGKEDRQ